MSNLILHICAIGFTAEKFLIAQAEHQRQQGYRVGFIFSPSPESIQLKALGFEVYELFIPRAMNPLHDLQAIWQMQLLLKQLKPTLIHTHTSKGGLIGRCAAWLAKVPHIVHTVHGFPFSEGMQAFKYWIFVFVERFLARLTHIMFSQSAEDVDLGHQYKILPIEKKIRHIGNGIDLSRFTRKTLSQNTSLLRSELKLPKDAIVLLTIGRVNHEKGYYELIPSMQKLPNHVNLVCVGFDEGHQQHLQKMSETLGIQDRIHWLGLRQDIPAIMESSNYFVLASHREGVPRSLIEAQAMGLPCIATNIRGCREVIIHNDTGLLIPPKNVEALEIALQELINNPDQAHRLALAGQKHVREHFDEQIVCEKIWQGYEMLLPKKKENTKP
jgi:glycosyltransferase involved in cell wall biosynthesis